MCNRLLLIAALGAACEKPIDVDQVVNQVTCQGLYRQSELNQHMFAAVEGRIRDAINLDERARLWAEKRVTAEQDHFGQFMAAARYVYSAGGSAQSLCEVAAAIHESMASTAEAIYDPVFLKVRLPIADSSDCPDASEVTGRPSSAMAKWKAVRAQWQRRESEYIERCRAKFGLVEQGTPIPLIRAGDEPSADDLLNRLRVK